MSGKGRRRRDRLARRRRLKQLQGTPRGARKERNLARHRAAHPRLSKWQRRQKQFTKGGGEWP